MKECKKNKQGKMTIIGNSISNTILIVLIIFAMLFTTIIYSSPSFGASGDYWDGYTTLPSSSTGTTLSSGNYKVTGNTTLSNSNGGSGLTITGNVTIYIAGSATLTVNGGAGSEGAGGGAGIDMTSSSANLYLRGSGNLNANGGAGASAESGNNGGESGFGGEDTASQRQWWTGTGGNGGNGGGSPGAGIGAPGVSGGSGGDGGASRGDIGGGFAGTSGSNGASGNSMQGNLYILDSVKVEANSGNVSVPGSGGIGALTKVGCFWLLNRWASNIGSSGGGGGGGGQSGASANIGSSGGGGGGGGGGASGTYANLYYADMAAIVPGTGGGGGGGNGQSGSFSTDYQTYTFDGSEFNDHGITIEIFPGQNGGAGGSKNGGSSGIEGQLPSIRGINAGDGQVAKPGGAGGDKGDGGATGGNVYVANTGAQCSSFGGGSTSDGDGAVANRSTISGSTVTYDLNDSEGSRATWSNTNNTFVKFDNFPENLQRTEPKRFRYTFLGWSTSSTATTATYTAGGIYNLNGSRTLYAVWSYDGEVITFDNGKGYGAQPNMIVKNGEVVTDVKPPRCENYVFDGYYTQPNAQGEKVFDEKGQVLASVRDTSSDTQSEYMIDADKKWTRDMYADLTVYAKWIYGIPDSLSSTPDSSGSVGGSSVPDGVIKGLDETHTYGYKNINSTETGPSSYTMVNETDPKGTTIDEVAAGAYLVRYHGSDTLAKDVGDAYAVVSKTLNKDDISISSGSISGVQIILNNVEDDTNYYVVDSGNRVIYIDERTDNNGVKSIVFDNLKGDTSYKIIATPKDSSVPLTQDGYDAIARAGAGSTVKVNEDSYYRIPILTSDSAIRKTEQKALVKFKSDISSGSYEYAVVNSGAPVPVDSNYKKGGNLTLNNTLSLTDLTSGEKDIYIRPLSDEGNHGNTIKMVIPPLSGISLSVSDGYDFGKARLGYPDKKPYQVIVSNTGKEDTGELKISLSGGESSDFIINKNTIDNVSVDSRTGFTVVPKSGLSLGTYEETVTVESTSDGNNNLTASFKVKFQVTKNPSGLTSVEDYTTITMIPSYEDGKNGLSLNDFFNIRTDGTITYSFSDGSTELKDKNNKTEAKIIDGKLYLSKAGKSYNIVAISAETSEYEAGGPANLNLTVLKGNQSSPTKWTVTAPSPIATGSNGIIAVPTGNGAKTEYALYGTTEYKNFVGDRATGLTNDDYILRHKENDLYLPSMPVVISGLEDQPVSSSVTLHLNGGVPSYEITSYVEGSTQNLPSATKKGNTFKGWYKTSALTGDSVNQIYSTDTGALNYYAKWEEDEYTITVDDSVKDFVTVSALSAKYQEVINVTSSAINNDSANLELEEGSLVYYKKGSKYENCYPLSIGSDTFEMPAHDIIISASVSKSEEDENADNIKDIINNGELPTADFQREEVIKKVLTFRINELLEEKGINLYITPGQITLDKFVKAKNTIPSKNGSYDYTVDFGEKANNTTGKRLDNVISCYTIIDGIRNIDVPKPKVGKTPSNVNNVKLNEHMVPHSQTSDIKWSPKIKNGTFNGNTTYTASITIKTKGSAIFANPDIKEHESGDYTIQAVNEDVDRIDKFVPKVKGATVKNVKFSADSKEVTFDAVFPATSKAKEENDSGMSNQSGDDFLLHILFITILLATIVMFILIKRREKHDSLYPPTR